MDSKMCLPLDKLIYRIAGLYLYHIKFPKCWAISCKNSVEYWLPSWETQGFPATPTFSCSGECKNPQHTALQTLQTPSAAWPKSHQPSVLASFLSLSRTHNVALNSYQLNHQLGQRIHISFILELKFSSGPGVHPNQSFEFLAPDFLMGWTWTIIPVCLSFRVVLKISKVRNLEDRIM